MSIHFDLSPLHDERCVVFILFTIIINILSFREIGSGWIYLTYLKFSGI